MTSFRSGECSRRNVLGRWLRLHAVELRLAPRVELAAGRFFDKPIHESGDRYRENHEDKDNDGTLIAQLTSSVVEIDADDHRVEQIEAVTGIPAKNEQAVLQDGAPIRSQSEAINDGRKGRPEQGRMQNRIRNDGAEVNDYDECDHPGKDHRQRKF